MSANPYNERKHYVYSSRDGALTTFVGDQLKLGASRADDKHSSEADLHIQSAGKATILLEADIGNNPAKESSLAQIWVRQDGNSLSAMYGLEQTNNAAGIRTYSANASLNVPIRFATGGDTSGNSGRIPTIDGEPVTRVEITDASTTVTNDLKVDTIDENTAAAGVTIEGVLLKDASITTENFSCSTSFGVFGEAATGQYNTTGTVTGFTAGSGNAVNHDSVFSGDVGTAEYTIGDIVRCLKQLGFMDPNAVI